MEEARSFVERSFGNYLGGEGVKRKMLEIEDMERRAQILLESVKASVQPAGASDPVVLKYAELQASCPPPVRFGSCCINPSSCGHREK